MGQVSFLMKVGELEIKTRIRNKLKDACKKLTQRQRKVTALVLLIVFAALVVASIIDTYQSSPQFLEHGHISPLEILETDTNTLKNNNNGTK